MTTLPETKQLVYVVKVTMAEGTNHHDIRSSLESATEKYLGVFPDDVRFVDSAWLDRVIVSPNAELCREEMEHYFGNAVKQ